MGSKGNEEGEDEKDMGRGQLKKVIMKGRKEGGTRKGCGINDNEEEEKIMRE